MEAYMAKLDWSHVKSNFLYPKGVYHAIISGAEYIEVKNGKIALRVPFLITAPAQYEDKKYSELFVIGTDDDPNAEEPETWYNSPGAGGIKRLLSYGGEDFPEDTDDIPGLIEGWNVGFLLGQRKRKDTGDLANQITKYVDPADVDAFVEEPEEAKASARGRAAWSEEDEDEEPKPRGKAPQAKKVRR
jgi:hypothetical protein